MSTPPNRSATAAKAARTEAGSVTSQATASARAADRLGRGARGRLGRRRASATSAPAAAKARAVATPMAPAAPVIAAIWPASGNSLAPPSLACSSDQYSQSNMSASEIDSKRPTASASVMVATAASARSAAMRGVLARAAEPEQAEPRHQHHPRQRIEHRLGAAAAGIVALEIAPVILHEGGDRGFGARGEVGLLAGLGRRQHQRPVLGADGVVGRHHAGRGIARDLGAVDEIEDRRRRCGSPGSGGGTRPRSWRRAALQAPRTIGATAASGSAACGSCAVANTARRPRCSAASASDTISIMRS